MSSLVCGKAQPVSLMSVLLVSLVSMNDKATDVTQQRQLPHSPSLSACFSQHEFSMSPREVGFLTILLPEPMPILMIDHSPLAVRGKWGDHRAKKKKKGEGGKRGVDNPTRSEWCPVFCFQWWDQWPVQPRGDRQSNWRPGRNRCSYTMNMHLVGCLFTKSQGADFPFLETKKNKA